MQTTDAGSTANVPIALPDATPGTTATLTNQDAGPSSAAPHTRSPIPAHRRQRSRRPHASDLGRHRLCAMQVDATCSGRTGAETSTPPSSLATIGGHPKATSVPVRRARRSPTPPRTRRSAGASTKCSFRSPPYRISPRRPPATALRHGGPTDRQTLPCRTQTSTQGSAVRLRQRAREAPKAKRSGRGGVERNLKCRANWCGRFQLGAARRETGHYPFRPESGHLGRRRLLQLRRPASGRAPNRSRSLFAQCRRSRRSLRARRHSPLRGLSTRDRRGRRRPRRRRPTRARPLLARQLRVHLLRVMLRPPCSPLPTSMRSWRRG